MHPDDDDCNATDLASSPWSYYCTIALFFLGFAMLVYYLSPSTWSPRCLRVGGYLRQQAVPDADPRSCPPRDFGRPRNCVNQPRVSII